MPSLKKLPSYMEGEWEWEQKEEMGPLLHGVWGTFYPSHKDELNDSTKRENSRTKYQDEVSKEFGKLFEKGFNRYLDSDNKFTKSTPRIHIKGLDSAQYTKIGLMRCCDKAEVDDRSETEGGTNSVASGSNDTAPHKGTTSITWGKPSKKKLKELMALTQAADTSVTPTIFNAQGPSSNSAATLALTLKRLKYPASTQDRLEQVQPMLTFCRRKGDKLDAMGGSAQTLNEFLQRFSIPKETWDSKLDSLVQEEWQSNVEAQKSCISGNGPSRTALETRLGHAIARYISATSNLANPLSVQYLQPQTYNILSSQYPAHGTFPFELIDKNGCLKKMVKLDKNKQLPPALR